MGTAVPLARLSPLSFVVQRKMEPPEGVSMRTPLVKSKNLQRLHYVHSCSYINMITLRISGLRIQLVIINFLLYFSQISAILVLDIYLP